MSNPVTEVIDLLDPDAEFDAYEFRYWLDQLPVYLWWFDARDIVQEAIIQQNNEAIDILREYYQFDDIFENCVISYYDGYRITYDMIDYY